ncbi:MAG: Z1 domain-containing protein [Thermodesulfobacteriota bacterium]|nr:Z1 domain-containing protein [Thermodesulfobacteriota bacterium]
MTIDVGDINGRGETFIEVTGQPCTGPGRWSPRLGSEANALELPSDSRDTILREAARILGRCVPPYESEGNLTGLIVGYVQSGKTMSFTTVAAMARDNGYQMVIVVAGTSIQLLEQSRDRLINDLRINSRTERRLWRHIPDPNVQNNSHQIIRNEIAEWRDQSVPAGERRTVLITVMKHHQHLQNLIDVLQSIDLNGVPTLIIDDEGDQAGLNTRINQEDQSTTYRRLITLKDHIPHHSFLQYTATPQAPLLINIVDVLSPNFAETVTPGEDYTGGREFFTGREELVRIIPQEEIPTGDNQVVGPPQSLLRAMRIFFIGAAAHLFTGDRIPNRSMMVHPSRLTNQHGQYYRWVENARRTWQNILEQSEGARDREELLELFRTDYEDLRLTEPTLPAFEDLQQRIPHAVRRTTVKEVNSVRGGTIVWSDTPYWILVGGQAMDRGFTVEGLTVTYMPRGPGMRNADTIQQRARFFGYKRGYRGYCRIFLEQYIRDAFNEYVEHEEDVRSQLVEHSRSGRSLREWRRQFFLRRGTRPTRNSVIDIPYQSRSFVNRWVFPEGAHNIEEILQENRETFERFLESLSLVEHEGLDTRQGSNKNLIDRGLSLRIVHEELLTRFRIRTLEDSQDISKLLRVIQFHLDSQPNEGCTIFLMGGGEAFRRSYENDRIVQVFQGRQYASGDLTYPGDRDIKDSDRITVQLRYLRLQNRGGPVLAERVPHIAVWVTAEIGRDFLDQPQGN